MDQLIPDDGRVTAETYVGWIEQKYENKKCIRWFKKLKINVKMHGEHNVKLQNTTMWIVPTVRPWNLQIVCYW